MLTLRTILLDEETFDEAAEFEEELVWLEELIPLNDDIFIAILGST